MTLRATWRVELALLAAGLLLASAAAAGAPRLSEPLSPTEAGGGAPSRLLVVAGAVWALALAALALTTARNAGVVRAGGRVSWRRTLISLLSLILVLIFLRFSVPEELGGAAGSGGGVGFLPSGWLSNPTTGMPVGLPASPGASEAGAALVLWAALAAGLAVLGLSVLALLRPGISLFGGLVGHAPEAEGGEGAGGEGTVGRAPGRRWRGARLQVIESYRSAVEYLSGRGVPMKPSWTPREHLEQVRRMGLPEALPLSDLERLFELARYSRRPVESGHAELARRLSNAIAGGEPGGEDREEA